MKRRKPTSPAALPLDARYTVHRPTVQALPPSTPRPRKKIGHAVKYVSPSARDSGNVSPIPRRIAIFFGVGGRAGWRK
jgi:hypothetical protein